MPLLVLFFLFKLCNIGCTLPTIVTAPCLGVSYWLGGLLTFITTAARLKELVLIIFTQRIPLIRIIIAVLRGKQSTFVTTGIV